MAKKRSAWRWVGRILLLLILLLLAWLLYLFGWVYWWKDHNPDTTRFMRERLATMQRDDPQATLRKQWVSYDDISIHLKRAVVAAEDDRFLMHNGFDWQGIQEAAERNAQRGRIAAGGSTITQQLAKNLFLSGKRSYVRKAQEAVITVMIEKTWSKRRILEVYLNVVEWGDGIYGAEAASRHYFQVSAARLGPVESVRLAVMLPNPRRYEQNFGPWLKRHSERIRSRMRATKIP